MTLERITLSPNRHALVTESGKPFFWLADTGWNAIHRFTSEEAAIYLDTRARQGFTVIQTVIIAEVDWAGPNPYGDQALINDDPTCPNEAFFRTVDAYLQLAAERGIYIALLPTWGHHVWPLWTGSRPYFTPENARIYGEFLGRRYHDQTNIIWCLGGDRPADEEGIDVRPIWRAMAAGIDAGTGGKAIFTFHPRGGARSSDWLNDEDWLDIHMMQSGHGSGPDVPNWEWIEHDFNLQPVRPTIDGEPNYEDHPINPWPSWKPQQGYYRDFDVRKQCYRSVFAGGAGVTYGHHSVWQAYGPRYDAINYPDRTWVEALTRPAAEQMQYLRWLIESRPCLERVPDQSLLAEVPAGRAEHPRAFRDEQGSYAMIYLPCFWSFTVCTEALKSDRLRAWWYNPRSGTAQEIGIFANNGELSFTTPLDGPDWVLVLDGVGMGYGQPGKTLLLNPGQ